MMTVDNDDCYPVATASGQGLSPKPPESASITSFLQYHHQGRRNIDH